MSRKVEMLRQALIWLGGLVSAAGCLLIIGHMIGTFFDLSPSYNIGNPAQFEFILVPLWQIGASLLAAGLALLLVVKWLLPARVRGP